MIGNVKFDNDSVIRGTVEINKANWSECMSINCSKLTDCQKIKIKDIQCVKENKLVQISSSIQDFGTFKVSGSFMKKFFAKLLKNKEYKQSIHNNTSQTFLDNIAKIVSGESSPDIEVSYCAFSSAFDNPDKDSALILEVGRVAITSATRSNSTVTVESSFGSTDANTLSTTVSGVTSTSVFDLTSVTGLQVGDALELALSGVGGRKETRKISNIATNTITVSTPYSSTITVNDIAKQKYGRLHLISGGTLTLNSGNAVSVAPYIDEKSSTDTIDVTHTIKFIGN